MRIPTYNESIVRINYYSNYVRFCIRHDFKKNATSLAAWNYINGINQTNKQKKKVNNNNTKNGGLKKW